MKNLYIIIAIVFVFRPVMPVVEYMINYEYISTVLCENVSKPELECNGKCHVAKEFEQISEQDTSTQLLKVVPLFEFIANLDYNASLDPTDSFDIVKHKVSKAYANFYTFLFCRLVLQPPIL